MTVCIARRRQTSGHYVLRIADKATANDIPDGQLSGMINELLRSKTHLQLVEALEKAPLLFTSSGAHAQPSRVMSPSECVEALSEVFTDTDPKILSSELFMYSPKKIRANVETGRSPAAKLDAYKCGFAEELSKFGDDKVVLVESIEDWMTARNMLAVAAVLLSGIEIPMADAGLMESAGFSSPAESPFDASVLATRLKFRPDELMPRHPAARAPLPDINVDDDDYLLNLYRDDDGGPSLPLLKTWGVRGSSDVFFAMHRCDENDARAFAPSTWKRHRYVYLCVKKRGTQLEMAKQVVLALWDATRRLVDRDGMPLGITEDLDSLFAPESAALSNTCHSLLSRMWNELCFHKGKRLVTCRHCGCGILASNRGPLKEYCSDSCRVQNRER